MTDPAGELADIRRRFLMLGESMSKTTPFYGRLARSVADDDDAMSLLLAHPDPQQRIPVLLFAAVHDLLLGEQGHHLAEWYGSIVDSPRTDDATAAFGTFCRENEQRIRAIISTRTTQTNEVGRCAFYLPAMHLLEREVGDLALIDVGASGGLNLQMASYSYAFGDRERIDPPSGSAVVTIRSTVNPDFPDIAALPTVSMRIGLDRHPIDVTDPEAARWLEACLWPDQTERFERLRGAIDIAAADPPTLIAGDAVVDLRATIDMATGGHPVVMNSWVLNYLSPGQRSEYVMVLDAAGGERDLSWVFAEAPAETPELPWPGHNPMPDATHLMLARWRDGARSVERLAICHPHGSRVEWVGRVS